jgi:DNA-binding MarR family transcriptional regulator
MPPRPRPRASLSHGRVAEELVRVVPLAARWIERLLAAHDPPLTVAQLLALEAAATGSATGAELARSAAVSPAAVSQLLSGLEDAGLLERARAGDDRRRQTVLLTAAGVEVLRSARLALRDGLGAVLGGLPPREADALARALARLAVELGGTPPPRRPSRPHPPRGHPPGR